MEGAAMASDGISRRAVTLTPAIPVTEESRERRSLLLLLAAVPTLLLGSCDFGSDNGDDNDD
jgi:hypothetical protein